jgi:glycosyltransferase involved in cell wall biosynthesis
MKQYFFSLFNELLSNEGKHSYIFFYFPHNVEELSNLNNNHWQESAILLNDQFEIKQYLDKIDVYFCPFSSLWPRPLPIPTVLFLHDIQEVFYPEFFTRSDMFSRDYHYPGSTRMADRVITNSDFTKQTIVQHHRISPEKVSVAHLCADERFFRAAEVARSPHFPLPNGNFIIYPANRWQHKNHDTLLRALQWLKVEKGRKIKAVFTGYDVPNCYPLARKASEYGLDGQVYSVGYVSVEELAYLYSKAKLMIFPSLFEGFGIPLVEAMAAGCPVLASNLTSLPEVGVDAIEYFDTSSPQSIGKAIERIWNDEARREELINRGLKRAQDFSAERLAHIHIMAFQKAVESFSMHKYLWNSWIYRRYHCGMLYFKYRKIIGRDQFVRQLLTLFRSWRV